MSDKNHHPAGGGLSKTWASVLANLAATRHNDPFCLARREIMIFLLKIETIF
jgi:hypothetical protein